ncbi:MAG: hypothetical protein SCH66_14130 [Methanolobus sp.]|nr:hypothetical protein [Methanolobus sp.]
MIKSCLVGCIASGTLDHFLVLFIQLEVGNDLVGDFSCQCSANEFDVVLVAFALLAVLA